MPPLDNASDRRGLSYIPSAKIAIASLVLFLIILFSNASHIAQAMHDILTFARSHYGWAILIVIALMVVHNVVPVLAEAIAMAAGAILGPVMGVFVIWCGAMCGACLAFWMARRWGRELILAVLPKTYGNRLNRITSENAWPTLLALRLIPVVSFNLWGQITI